MMNKIKMKSIKTKFKRIMKILKSKRKEKTKTKKVKMKK